LVTRKWPALASKATTSRRVVWLVPAALLGVIWLVQWPVFRLSEEVRRNFAQIRSEILQTNLSHAFVVESDLIDVRPAYLRSVAFLLFSDRTLVDRDLLFYTEWHGQARHPTRLTENWFELGRQQYVASFRAEADGLHVRLKAQPAGEVAIATRNNAFENSQMALWAKGRGDTLYLSGHYRDALAQYRSAARLAPGLWEIHNNFASTCAQLGLNGEAIAGYEAALQIKSDLPEAHSSLGYLLLATGRKAEAATHFEATLRLKPDHVAARQGLAQSAAAR
jgi:tetratricopeptide (TPR) repeat protein